MKTRTRNGMRWRGVLLVPALFALVLAACNGDDPVVEDPNDAADDAADENGDDEQGAFDDADSVELTIGHAGSTDQLIHQWAEDWADAVDAATDGTVTIDLVPDAQLGGELDIVQQVSLGAVEGVITGATGNDDIDALFAPYLFRDGQHMLDVLDSDIVEPWIDGWRDSANVQVVGFLERSPRQISANRPIESADDLGGFTIRVPEIDAMVDGFNAAGASPTPMAWPEVYTSLQTGAIDGQENPIEIIGGEQLDEVQDYLILSEHVYTPWTIALNGDTYDSLSEAQRDALQETFQQLRPEHSAALAEEVDEMRATLEERGMEVIEPDIDSFRDAMQPAALDNVAEVWGEETAERVAEGS